MTKEQLIKQAYDLIDHKTGKEKLLIQRICENGTPDTIDPVLSNLEELSKEFEKVTTKLINLVEDEKIH